jgi:hypothetical protein
MVVRLDKIEHGSCAVIFSVELGGIYSRVLAVSNGTEHIEMSQAESQDRRKKYKGKPQKGRIQGHQVEGQWN